VHELTPQLENSRETETTPFQDGDQLDFNLEHASEGRAKADVIQNLSRIAREEADAQLVQLETPEIPSVYPSLVQIGSIIEQMRDDYDMSHIHLN
jgi:hypothetical protein